MSNVSLDNLQYEIGDFVFGRSTEFTVQRVEFGPPQLRNQDVNKSRTDGMRFGRDYKASRTITFDLNVLTPPDPALSALDQLAAAWSGDAVRRTPGATTTLRWNRGGRTRRVWGRPREFESVTGRTLSGWIPVTATFVTEGPYFYEDEQQSVTVDFVPPTGSGFTVPYTVPLTFSGVNPSQGSFTLDTVPPLTTPLEIQINGPITNPRIVFDNDLVVELRVSIASDDYALIDPISMTVMSRFGQNWSGKLTPDSTYLSGIELGAGTHNAVLTGTDSTGSSSTTIRWRTVHASY